MIFVPTVPVTVGEATNAGMDVTTGTTFGLMRIVTGVELPCPMRFEAFSTTVKSPLCPAAGVPVTKPGPKGAIPWSVPANGACGQMSASSGMLFYRDGYTVMRDTGTGNTLMAFTGMRPGCLINIVPAGGVIVQVEASSGCTCYHAIQSTVVFVPSGAE